MNIGIDIRPLLDSVRSGVGEYTQNLLEAIFEKDVKTSDVPRTSDVGTTGENQYFLFYNVWNKKLERNLPKFHYSNARLCGTHFPSKFFNLSLRFLKWPKLDRIIEKKFGKKIDIFFFPNTAFSAVSSDCKKIISCHDISFVVNPSWFSLRRRFWHKIINPNRFFKNADKIIAVSKNTKRDLVDIFKIPEEKIKVIYSGIKVFLNVIPAKAGIQKSFGLDSPVKLGNDNEVKQKFNLPQKFILYLGTNEPRKNILGIIKAFEVWKKDSEIARDFSLVLAGSNVGSSRKVKQAINQSSFKEDIKYLGFVSNKEKFALYHLAKLFLYPSFYEGFGFPPLEAMSCGTPVVASANSSFPEILGDAALLVNPYDINDIARGIEGVLGDETVYNHFVEKGRERVKRFSWEKSGEEWLDLISKFQF